LVLFAIDIKMDPARHLLAAGQFAEELGAEAGFDASLAQPC
jgi:hypothetical protein